MQGKKVKCKESIIVTERTQESFLQTFVSHRR